jgi:hypothetical protein
LRPAPDLHQPPLLVGAVAVGVLGDPGAVRGGPLPDVQCLAAVAVDQLDEVTVGIDHAELLIGSVVVGVLLDVRAVRGGLRLDVQHLAAVPGPKLVVATAGVDELELLVGRRAGGALDERGPVGR